MVFALFGINNGALNLVVNLLVLFLVVVYFALVAWTYFDAKRRMQDQVLVWCSVGASLFPFIGTVVYTILRPPEFLEDAHEREVEVRAAELRLRQLNEQSCPNCEYPIEKSYLRCPNCQARVKDPCPKCNKPLDPRWVMCPYCETPVQRRAPARRRQEARPARRAAPQERAPAKQPGKRSAKPQRRQAASGAARRAGSSAKQPPKSGGSGDGEGGEGQRASEGAGEERSRPATAS
jgi:heme exporter protein D